jgi:hypothetical protein
LINFFQLERLKGKMTEFGGSQKSPKSPCWSPGFLVFVASRVGYLLGLCQLWTYPINNPMKTLWLEPNSHKKRKIFPSLASHPLPVCIEKTANPISPFHLRFSGLILEDWFSNWFSNQPFFLWRNTIWKH